jgi:hypothetical protein
MPMSASRACRILGVQPGTPPAEIKTAYRDLAQVWHPDRFAHDERLRKKAEETLQRINEAWQVLEALSPAELASVRPGFRDSVSMMLGLGELRPPPPGPPPFGTADNPRLLALGRFRPSTELKVRRAGGRPGWWWLLPAALAVLAAALILR